MKSKPKDITIHMNTCLCECPYWITDKSIVKLKTILDETIMMDIRHMYALDPDEWWAIHHHGWGTNIRNFLRANVCTDDKLPSGNWDDYYIQMVELTCGIR